MAFGHLSTVIGYLSNDQWLQTNDHLNIDHISKDVIEDEDKSKAKQNSQA